MYFMTIGLLLAMIGTQLYLVRTYSLKPNAARLVSAMFDEAQPAPPSGGGISSLFSPASYSASPPLSPKRNFSPPHWVCWPALFIGAVFFLHGAAMRRA
jgi:hypothetical protein